ncbi:amino acid adenylation domain-containing protein [Kitasatospora sp. NBC_01287]|uniref:non-ribosomal peptide synthetase n=1 Tax=Kitasatospora sp. NBC_01287 TaxID=2903573 RepID=UPI002259FCA4|nr:non-ribosomal peptide synthetase [Kitasatospora sp. NBC_01287]MCX4750084.1 amino acid adenylation domain-containing protein [Kitasatospora sp. NBC_01287]
MTATNQEHGGLELVQRFRTLSPKQQRAVRALLEKQGVDLSLLDVIPRVPRSADDLAPLSSTQQRLWFLAQLDGSSAAAAYNLPGATRLLGPLDRPALVRALDAVVQRHEATRTRFVVKDGVPYQHVGDGSEFSLRTEELADPARLPLLMEREATTPFDLDRDPLVRVRLLRLSEQEHVLLITMHHTVCDGWSYRVINRDLALLYEAFRAGQPNPLKPLPIQYADFAHWQRDWFAGEEYARRLDYWTTRLAGVNPRLSLPTDRPRPPVKTYNGAREVFRCPPALVDKLHAVATQHGATLYMTLLAAYNVVLHRYTQQTDIAVGTVVANRIRPELEGLVGYFANTLVIRADLTDDPTFSELLTQVRRTTLEAYDHQDIPFEAVVEALQLERDLSQHSPAFQTMFVLQEAWAEPVTRVGGLELRLLDIDIPVAKFDLAFELQETPDGLVGTVEYNTDLFDRETIQRLVHHYTTMLDVVADEPAGRISRLRMLDAAERRRALLEWNELPADVESAQRCLHQWFEEVVSGAPDAVAVAYGDESLTYAELNARANRLARHLRRLGVAPGVLVALCLPRSEQILVSVLAVLKAGGAYLPLDPAVPAERLEYVLEDAAPRVLLVDGAVPEGVAWSAGPVIDVRVDAGQWADASADDLVAGEVGSSPADLAYVIYTSGSTGKPKGVMIEHRNVTRLLTATRQWFDFGREDVWPLFHSFAFDVSVWEMWGALLHGGRLVVVPQAVTRNPREFYELLCANGVTVLNQTPSAFGQLITAQGDQGAPHRIRAVVFAGEALDVAALEPWMRRPVNRGTRLVNMYGTTETTVHATHRVVTEDDTDSSASPIGQRIPDLRTYVLDGHGEPVPVGAVGEIYLGGAGVGRGYLNRPELTRERFLPDPFSGRPGDRMYRTGDLARQLPDGSMEYLGRNDDQVKIRGFRIELGEIEAVVGRHPAVLSCVVAAREDQPGNKQLVAYVVLADGQAGQVEQAEQEQRTELRRLAERALPEYMVPSAFVMLESLPLTNNGKLDRRALPAPGIDAYTQREYIAPSTATERALAAVWADLLGFDPDRVSAHDNFFQLGGHSLLITVLVARLKELGFDVPVRSVFSSPTLARLATEIDAGTAGPAYQPPPSLIPDGCERITPQLLPLIDLDQAQIDAITATVPGGAPNIQDIYPLASAQEGILFHHLLDPDNDPYLVSLLLVAENEQVCVRFTEALQALIARHDVMRTAVITTGLPEPAQVVYRSARLTVDRTTLDPHADIEQQVNTLLDQPARMRVDQAPMLRLLVAEDPGSDRRYLLLSAHHLVEDATTLWLFLKEMAVHMAGRSEELAPAPPYRDFVAHTLHQTASADGEAYFRAALGDVTEPTTPFGLTNVRGDGHQYPQLRRAMPVELTRDLRAQAMRLRTSPACLFHVAWACVVAAASGRDDVVLGTVLSGRLQGVPGVERMLGNFINTLPLRVRLAGRTVRELISEVDAGLQELIAREQSPLSLAQRCSGLDVDTQIFSAVVNVRHFDGVPGAETSPLEDQGIHWQGEADAINYPLVVSLDDFGAEFAYHVRVDDSVACETLVDYVETALSGIVAALAADDGASTPALAIEVLSPAERRRVLTEWNQPPAALAAPARCLHEWFQDVARKTPDAVALEYEGRTLTYRELNARANRLARHLRGLGVGRDVLVALALPRSEQLMVCVLAVLKAGGAYVPVDPTVPVERLRYILGDSRPRALLTDGPLPEGLDTSGVPVVDIRVDADRWADEPDGDLAGTAVAPADLAYVIYTSGSTGAPKGVLVEHRNVTRLFTATEEWFGFGGEDVWTLFHSFAFDFSVWEMWGALLYGGRLVVVPQAVTRNPREFYELLCANGVTVLNQTPSAFGQLITAQGDQGAPHRLRTVVFGGEALDVAALEPWMRRPVNRGTRLVNMYGITETTVHVTYRPLNAADADGSASPIGQRIPDLRTYVLDGHGEPVPVGAVGELYVGGAGVARGYLNRPELTRERFLPDPFSGRPGDRMYRTGDLARQLPDGSMEYLGRNDDQVKIRGFRIELGEIEAALAQHGTVAQSVVLPQESGDGRTLVGYVCPSPEWLDEVAQEQNATLVEQWQRVFEDEYAGSQDADTSDDLNLAGWENSYTGEPIPVSDMREWIDGTVRLIEELRPKRLLEVGCGTGLLLLRYAGACESVHALDLSASALDDVRRGAERRGWSHVTLAQGDALSAAALPEGTFDTIVVNSVVQYFPNRLYLEEAIARLLPLLAEGGRILIGDVRNLDLLSAHLGAVERSRARSGTTAGALAARLRRRRRHESELLLSPSYFARLGERFPELGAVDLMVKRGVGDNEMLAYRYDVVLTKSAVTSVAPLAWLEAADPGALRDLLDGDLPNRFGVTGLTNSRIREDVRVAEGVTLWSPGHEVAPLPGEARLSAAAAAEARELEALLRRAEELGYRVSATWSQSRLDGLDLVFGRGELPPVQARAPYRAPHLANVPRLADLVPAVARLLREHLSTRLPEYLVPSAFVLLEELPLTPNGKIDKRALPAPDENDVAKEAYVAPHTDAQRTLCRVLESTLGTGRIGIRDNFFALGGDSLLAVRLAMRIRQETGTDISLQAVLTSTTIEEMASALEQSATTPAVEPLLPAATEQAGAQAPLSLQQRELWFLDWPEHLGASYRNAQLTLRITGRLDRDAYTRAVRALVERHPVLRTGYVRDEEVTQRVTDGAGFTVNVMNVDDQDAAIEWLRAERVRPFAPDDRAMLRAHLLVLSESEHVVAFTRPWGVFDGWSVNLLLADLFEMCRAFSKGEEPRLTPLQLTYADFARWQSRTVDAAELGRQEEYWRRQLAGLPACSSLRTDYPRGPVRSYQGASVEFEIPLDLLTRIRALSQEEGVTLYTALLSAYAVLLGGYTRDRELAIGTPVANRPGPELEHVVGMFVSELVMRLDVTRDRAFTAVLAQAKQVMIEGQQHKDLPRADLVRALVPEPDPACPPLSQVMFNLLPRPASAPGGADGPAELQVTQLRSDPGPAMFDLTLTATETESGVRCSLAYSTDLFARGTAERMALYYERLLREIAAAPEADLDALRARAGLPEEV